jgi:hypothetical protein
MKFLHKNAETRKYLQTADFAIIPVPLPAMKKPPRQEAYIIKNRFPENGIIIYPT